jgi:CRP-like cAMP-binding protein
MAKSNPFLLNLESRDVLTDRERDIAGSLCERRHMLHTGADIVREGDSPSHSCLLLSGFAARYNVLGDGRRQITAVHVAGDFIDLHSLLLTTMDHSVLALDDCEVAFVAHDLLRDLTTREAHFTRMLWLMTVIDAAAYRQWLVAAGRLSSAAQIAHFICEMHQRLRLVDLVEGRSFRLPMSQIDLSDAMGLSVVHVNRTLQLLRRRSLIAWQGDNVTILDLDGLQRLAEFDPAYLDTTRSPR